MKTLVTCPCCGEAIADWSPHRVAGRLLITFKHCNRTFTAEADFVVTSIREGMRLVKVVE